jgi:uncharacterized membrane protein YqjE
MTTENQSRRPDHGALRRLINAILAMTQAKLELIGIELAEEKERLLAVLFLGLAAVVLASMALFALTVLIAIAFWDTWRWQAFLGITVIYALGALFCGLKARNGLRHAPLAFQTTLDELEKDRDMFRK